MKNTYLNKINLIERLTPEKETELFIRYKEDDCQDSLNYIIECNLKNAYNLSLNFYKKNDYLELSELVCESNLILIQCVKKYNYQLGFLFYTYLKNAVRNGLVDLINQYQNVKLPSRKYVNFGKIEISNDFNMFTDREIRSYELYSNYKYVRFGDDSDFNNQFDISDNHQTEAEQIKEQFTQIQSHFNKLNIDELFIIHNYFGLGETEKVKLKDIAKLMGCSNSKVHQLKKNALKKLKDIEL